MIAPTYRIGNSDRSGAARPPEGFVVVNLCNNKAFEVQSGQWVEVSIPAGLLASWRLT